MIEYGYVKSKLELSDRILSKEPTIKLPENYMLSGGLGPIRDQGQVPKCTSVALYDIVDWNLRLEGGNISVRDDYFFLNRKNKSIRGMSPKEAFEILRYSGIPSSKGLYHKCIYARMKSIRIMKNAILSNGPILIGLPVYSTEDEFWKGGKNLIGGHAVTFVGWNPEGFILRNSWGYDYGQGGYINYNYNDVNLIYEAWTLIK